MSVFDFNFFLQLCIAVPCHIFKLWAFLGIMFQVRWDVNDTKVYLLLCYLFFLCKTNLLLLSTFVKKCAYYLLNVLNWFPKPGSLGFAYKFPAKEVPELHGMCLSLHWFSGSFVSGSEGFGILLDLIFELKQTEAVLKTL